MTSLAIGIDFGTTKSHLAYIPRNSGEQTPPRMATYEDALHLTPRKDDIPDFRVRAGGNIQPVPTVVSVKRPALHFSDEMSWSIRCGYRAVNLNEEDYADYIIVDRLKQYMGWSTKIIGEIEPKQSLTVEPEGLAARFLSELYRGAIEIRDYQADALGVTITVPAKSTLPQRMATQFAAAVAGFSGEIYVLEEPVSAFLFHRHSEPGRFITPPHKARFAVVFDFGGGTCDVAVVKYQEGRLPIVTGRAMGRFGGEDIDQMLLGYFWARQKKGSADPDRLPYTIEEIENNPKINRNLLLRYARLTKELLSSTKAEDQAWIQDYHAEEVGKRAMPLVKRAQLEQMLKKEETTRTVAGHERSDSIRGHILTLLREALRESEIKRDRIEKLIFAGGSSQLVGARDWVLEYFFTSDASLGDPNTRLDDKDIIFSDLETSIAGGAAVHQFYRHSDKIELRQVVTPTLPAKIRLVHYRNPGNTERREIVLGDSTQPLKISKMSYWRAPVIFPVKRIEDRPVHIEIIQGEEKSPEFVQLGEADLAKNGDAVAILVKYLIDEYGVVDRIILVPLSKFLFWQWKRKERINRLHLPEEEVRTKLEHLALTNRGRINHIRAKYLNEN